MSQNHSVTKRNRRQKSHTRGSEGRATQLALRSPEAREAARKQDNEVTNNKLRDAMSAIVRKDLKASKKAEIKGDA